MYETMISELTVKRFCCEDLSLIENYNEAINDTTQTWDCHHRLEIELNKRIHELNELGLYYNRPASELIFLTHKDHISLHNKGKIFSDEHRKKLSNARKVREPLNKGKHGCQAAWNKGKSWNIETKQKMSEARKAYLNKKKQTSLSLF